MDLGEPEFGEPAGFCGPAPGFGEPEPGEPEPGEPAWFLW